MSVVSLFSRNSNSKPAPGGVVVTIAGQSVRYRRRDAATEPADLTGAGALKQLNATIQQPTFAWIALVAGGLLGIVLAPWFLLIALATFAATLYAAWVLHRRDWERRHFPLFYEMDDEARRRWRRLNESFDQLSRAHTIWHVTTPERKPEAETSPLAAPNAPLPLNRARARLAQRPAERIAANVTPYCLELGGQQTYFFPDRAYVYQHGAYGVVEYDSLRIDVGQTSFVEENGVPAADRYGVVTLTSRKGLSILLHVSSLNAVQQFGRLFPQAHMPSPAAPPPTSRPRTSPPPPWNPPPPGPRPLPPSAPIPSCYDVLGLTPGCTREEATARYRHLAMSYHPDRVSHLPVEFGDLAQQKTTEINVAYDNLKKQNGW